MDGLFVAFNFPFYCVVLIDYSVIKVYFLHEFTLQSIQSSVNPAPVSPLLNLHIKGLHQHNNHRITHLSLRSSAVVNDCTRL